MTQPSPLGPITDLLYDRQGVLLSDHSWHVLEVKMPNGGLAGRWAVQQLQGEWTFKPDFGRVWFYIRDKRDAMAFKLAWGCL